MSQITSLKSLSSKDCNICLNPTVGTILTIGIFVQILFDIKETESIITVDKSPLFQCYHCTFSACFECLKSWCNAKEECPGCRAPINRKDVIDIFLKT